MYVREVQGRTLTFQVSGKLWMHSLVMRDVETESEWAHLPGKAMAGPLKGSRLKPIITDMVTWKAWRSLHPDTTVLNLPAVTRRYRKEFYDSPDKFLFGFEVNGHAMALPMNKMLQHSVYQFESHDLPLLATFDKEGAGTHLFNPQVDGRLLTFSAMDQLTMTDGQTDSMWNLRDGVCTEGPMKGKALQQRVGIMSFRKAWQNFHPDSKDVSFP